MSNDNQNTSPLFIDRNNKQLTPVQKMNQLKEVLTDSSFVSDLQVQIDNNEKHQRNAFEGFTDEMMMYAFIHKPSHIKDEYNKKGNTKKEYIRDLHQFFSLLYNSRDFFKEDVLNYTEGSLLRNLEKRHIRRYQEWLKNEAQLKNGKIGYGMATMARKVVIIKSFLKWLFQVEYIQRPIYAAFLNNEIRIKDRPVRDLTYEQVKALIDFYEYHPFNHAILTLLATTGLRIDEIAKSTWSDLYYDPRQNNCYLKVIAKGGKERHALIKETVFERLQKLRIRKRLSSELDPNDQSPIFTTNRGNSYNASDFSRYVKNMIKQTKFEFLKYKPKDVTPHWFRHYFAQEAHASGAPLLYIQNTLDHKKSETTEIYLKGIMKKENDAAQYVDESKY
ncbi:tyrosine-type recombinase/integrase [Chengkuizengella axinellae]|uniref:Tyrosine-type recombinase/integrase n=1 Tax=Chengkuizengella axinellae TaxID=3064388 RepID=A0ABT9J3L4_9BACL|nr:tyrosine-type recombinase/integrase [Chengkuizengella sp. 2205SS18-9]MDP5276153.1 tyrosine-type recombinase/integrase [Chengkuizengella sp. 2205SS18-9]